MQPGLRTTVLRTPNILYAPLSVATYPRVWGTSHLPTSSGGLLGHDLQFAYARQGGGMFGEPWKTEFGLKKEEV